MYANQGPRPLTPCSTPELRKCTVKRSLSDEVDDFSPEKGSKSQTVQCCHDDVNHYPFVKRKAKISAVMHSEDHGLPCFTNV